MSEQRPCSYCSGRVKDSQQTLPTGTKARPEVMHANWQDCSAAWRPAIKLRARADGKVVNSDREVSM